MAKCVGWAPPTTADGGRSPPYDWSLSVVTKTLDYADANSRRTSKIVQRFAFASLFLPLMVVGTLYGEWLLATWSLGHPPRPSLDDPKDIAGSSWMHEITMLAILCAIPGAIAAFSLNAVEIGVNRRSTSRAAIR